MTKRRIYDSEFKRMAVELLESGKTSTEVGFDLGIRSDLVRRWRRELKYSNGSCFSGNGNLNLTPDQLELSKLRKELQDVKLERDILKKAVGIFSRSDG